MFAIPEPELQVAFSIALVEIREAMLQEALGETVKKLSIPEIDKELATIVPAHSLALLASHGLRGELMFAVPAVLKANPRLIGYYRLLYGYSQKLFYAATVAGRLKALEESGQISKANEPIIEDFCKEMAKAGAMLLAGLNTSTVSSALLDDLTLLTLGPQLRGSRNVTIGTAAIVSVFGAIKEIVGGSITASDTRRMELTNAAGRKVLIEFAADPDIIIREQMTTGSFRQLIAIEIKGGTDFSNIHNRLGEAEKSHQKARAAGYTECWTVVNVDAMDMVMARKESPSTNRFYKISDLISATGGEYDDFRARIIGLTGIKAA
ncbi:XcyI family restriction endonuclease [Phreatobacter sp. HK31-P]